MDRETEAQASGSVEEEPVTVMGDKQAAVTVDISSAKADKDGLEVGDSVDYDGGADSKEVLPERDLTLEPVAGESENRTSQLGENLHSQLSTGNDYEVALPESQEQVTGKVEERSGELEEELSSEMCIGDNLEIDVTEQKKVTSKDEDKCSELEGKLSMEMCSESNGEDGKTGVAKDRDQVSGESLVYDLNNEMVESQCVKLDNVVEDEVDGSGKLPGTLNSDPEADLTHVSTQKEKFEHDGKVIEDFGKGACVETKERGMEAIACESRGDSSNHCKDLDTGISNEIEVKMNLKSEIGDKSEMVDTNVKAVKKESRGEVISRCEDQELTVVEGEKVCADDQELTVVEGEKVCADDQELTVVEGEKVCANDQELTVVEGEKVCADDQELTVVEGEKVCADDQELTVVEGEKVCANDQELTVVEGEKVCADDQELTVGVGKEVCADDQELTGVVGKEVCADGQELTGGVGKEVCADDQELTSIDEKVCADNDDRNLSEHYLKDKSDVKHLYKKSEGKIYQQAGGIKLKTLKVMLDRLKMPVDMAEGRKSPASSTSSIQTRSRARAEYMEKTGKDYKDIIQVTTKKTPDPLIFKKSKKGWKRYIKKKAVFSDDLTKLYEKSKRLVDKVQSTFTVDELKHKCNKAYCSAMAKQGDSVKDALRKTRNSRNVRFAQSFERFAYEYVNPAHFMYDNRPFSERFDSNPSEGDTSEEETDGTESLEGAEGMDDDTESNPEAGKYLNPCSGELDPCTGELIGNTTVSDETSADIDNKCRDSDSPSEFAKDPSEFAKDSIGDSDLMVEDTKENTKAMEKSARQAQASDGNIGKEHSINPLTGDIEFTDSKSEEVSCENDCENDSIEENKPFGKTCVKDTYTAVNSELFYNEEKHYIDRKKQLFAKWKKHVERAVKLAIRLKECEDSGKGVYKHDSLSDKCLVVMKSMLMFDMEKNLVRALEETKQLSDMLNGAFLEDIDNVEHVIQAVTVKMTAKLKEILYADKGKSPIKDQCGQEGVDEIVCEVTDEIFAINDSAYKAWKQKQTSLFQATEKEASWLVNVNRREQQMAKGLNMACFERSSDEETQKRKGEEIQCQVTMQGSSCILRKKVKREESSVEVGTVQTETGYVMAQKETSIRNNPRDKDRGEQERSRLNLPIKPLSCEDMLLNLVMKEAEKQRELNRMEQNIAIKKNILASIAEAGRDPGRQIPGQGTEGTAAATGLATRIKQEPDDSQENIDGHQSAQKVKIKTETEEFESNEPPVEIFEEGDNNPVPTFLVKMNQENTGFMVYPADSLPELGVLESPIACLPEAGHEQTELKSSNKRLKREVPGILKKRPKLDMQLGAGSMADSKGTVSGLDHDKLTRMTKRDVDKLAEHMISKYDDAEDTIETHMSPELELPIPVDHTPVGLQRATIPTSAASARDSPGVSFPTIVDHTTGHAGPARQTVTTDRTSAEPSAAGTVRGVPRNRTPQYITTIEDASNQQHTGPVKCVYKRPPPPPYTAAVMAKSAVHPPQYTAATPGKSSLQSSQYAAATPGKSTLQPPSYTASADGKLTLLPQKYTGATPGKTTQQPPEHSVTLKDGPSAGKPCVRQLVPSPPGLVNVSPDPAPTSSVPHMAASRSGTARGASPKLTVTLASGASTGKPHVRQLVVAPTGLVNIAPRPAPVAGGPQAPQFTTTVIDGASSSKPTIGKPARKRKRLPKAGPSPAPVVPGISSPPELVNMAPKPSPAAPVGHMVSSPPALVNMAPSPAPVMPGLPTVPPGGGLVSSMQLYQQGGQQYVAMATNQPGSDTPQQMLYKVAVVPGSSNCYLVPENQMVVQGMQNVQPVVQGVQNVQQMPQQSSAPMLMLVPNSPVQTQLVPAATTPQPASLEPEAHASLVPEKDTQELQPKILNVFSMKGIDLSDELNAKMVTEKNTPNNDITGIETIETTDNSTIICQESAYCVIAERDIRSGLQAYGRITKRSNKSTDLVEFSFLLTKVLDAEGITLKKAAKQSSTQSNRPDTSDKEIVAKVVDVLKILRLAITVEAVSLLCAFLRKIADMKSWLITIPNLTQILFFVKRYAVSSFNPAFFTEPRQPHRMYFWTCQICAKSCKSEDTFLKHTAEHRRFLTAKMKDLAKEHVFHHCNMSVCLFCKRMFTAPEDFYTHFNWPCSKELPDQLSSLHVSKDLQTIYQSKSKVRPTFDAAYFSIKLPYPELFKCKICLKTFSDDDSLKEHLLKDHEGWHEVQLLCSKCDINFQHNPVEFFDHVKLHQVGDEDCPFQCLKCQATFWFSLSLTVHHRISHKRGKTINPATVVAPESATGVDAQVDVESLDEVGTSTTTARAQDGSNITVQCTTAVVGTGGAASADKPSADDFDLNEDFRSDMEKRKTDLEMKKLSLLMELKKRKEELKKIVTVRSDETDSPVKVLSSGDGATEPVEGNKGSEQLNKRQPTEAGKSVIPTANYWCKGKRKRQHAFKQRPGTTRNSTSSIAKKSKSETENKRVDPEPTSQYKVITDPEPTSQYKVITDDSYLSQIPSFDEVMSSLQQRSSTPVAKTPPVAVAAAHAAEIHPTTRDMLGGPSSGAKAETKAGGMRSTYSAGGSGDKAETKVWGMRSTYSAAEVMKNPDMFRDLTGARVELKRLIHVEILCLAEPR